MNNYVDVKISVWNRFHFKDDTDMENIARIIREEGFDSIISDELGFLETQNLYETEEQLEPEDNGGCSTIEVYKDDQPLWNNGTEQ